jgi:cell division protein ZapA (FtsZ GTPase activity inhibitor)
MSGSKQSKKAEKRGGSLVPVTIFGHTYKVRADEDGPYIEEIARFVDTKMKALAAESPGTTEHLSLAVLAALNIADELFKLEQRQKSAESILADATGEMLKALEDSLREPTQTSPVRG